MKDRLLFIVFSIIYYIINIIPDKIRKYLGLGLGNFIYYLLKSRREISKENLKKAFIDKYNEEELKCLNKKIFQQMGLTMIEFMLLGDDNIADIIDIEGLNYLDEAYKKGQGVIVYSAHFGNWEWLVSTISEMGYPVNAIARKQDNMYFDQKINDIRSSKGVNIIPKGISVRQAFKALRNGEILFILGDQNARSHGWCLDFFSHPASVFPGAVQLASRTGALIVQAYLIREEWGKHNLEFYPSYDIGKGADEEEQRELLKELNKNMEKIITDHPDQWLWMHRRWNNKFTKRG